MVNIDYKAVLEIGLYQIGKKQHESKYWHLRVHSSMQISSTAVYDANHNGAQTDRMTNK